MRIHPWCLAELELMLKTGAKIVPLFYDVKPYALRYAEKGVYADAFTKYREKGRYIDKLEKWQKALHEASFITGIEVDAFKGNMGDLCKTVVDTVVNEVREGKTKLKLDFVDRPLGLDEIVKEIDDVISSIVLYIPGNGRIVGIVGDAGMGKTTAAKEFYNRFHPSFHRSSFLLDIGEAHRNKNMAQMQYKLMCDLSMPLSLSFPRGPKEGFGVEMIKSHLEYMYSQPLIVFDGVDHQDQLAALALMEILSHGALVIVTCNDADILRNVVQPYSGFVQFYEMRGMESKYARELLCWHAFRQSHPPIGCEKLVENMLKVSGGSPSNLKIVGESIYSMQAPK